MTGTFVIAGVAAASIILAASAAGAAMRTGRLVDPIQPTNRGTPSPLP